MRSGQCPKCGSANIYTKQFGLEGPKVDGKMVSASEDYICTDCGYFETYVKDKDMLNRIVQRAEKLGDWKKVK